MKIKQITVAGAGTLGSQIAFQTALCGLPVKIYNPHPDRAKTRLAKLAPMFKKALKLTSAAITAAQNNIKVIDNDWEHPFAGSDLIIEALSENLKIKQDFYAEVVKHVDNEVIIASNSSTMMPSQLSKFVAHPERFLHMHFANHIWQFNTLEIVGTDKTKPEVMQAVISFAKQIKMLPIRLKKENPGYIMNALSIPLLKAALWVWANGVADPITIDKDWMSSSGMPMGPFMLLDMVGIRTAYAISAAQKDPASQLVAGKLKQMLDAGKTGELAGEGFYKYPNPAFADPDFLKA